MAKTAADTIRGAFERARGRGALVHFLATSTGGYDAYSVGSTADLDTAYTVTVLGATYRCTCPAEGNVACWHRAAVFNHRASREAFGLPAVAATVDAAQAKRAADRERDTSTVLPADFDGMLKPERAPAARRLPPTDDVAALDALFAA